MGRGLGGVFCGKDSGNHSDTVHTAAAEFQNIFCVFCDELLRATLVDAAVQAMKQSIVNGIVLGFLALTENFRRGEASQL